MLVFNLRRVLALRGIDKPFGFLLAKGFTRTTAANLSNDRVLQIKVSHLEALCRTLNCTPNDLFEWKTDANTSLKENHALNSLEKGERPPPISEMVKDIPIEKMDKIAALLDEIKNS